ncbi:MAG TPA: thiamine pyrophosphate-binding protein [Stellaceae bacterium]|nr:thiamine pyrophosphate-binding protein [Stellaceae bacterium]
MNDERCGAFAADAYARVTNRPGICDATLGPGDQPRHRADRVAEWRYPDCRHRRRHQSQSLLEEHDPGESSGRNPETCGQGADPRRNDKPRARTGAARFCRRDLRPTGSGLARRA